MEQARCLQYWGVFAVRGITGTYEVYAADILAGTWTCSCKAFAFRRTCKHIAQVRLHGCFGHGLNDFDAFGIEITGTNPSRGSTPTDALCVCGQPMLEPLIRTDDGAGHQIVQVTFGGPAYTYASSRALAVGETVNVGGNPGTVVGLGSDWAGPLKVVA